MKTKPQKVKRKPGRPPAGDRLLGERFVIICSAEDVETWKEQAAQASMSASGWARARLQDASR